MPLPFRLECELTSQNPTVSFFRLKEKVYVHVEILAVTPNKENEIF